MTTQSGIKQNFKSIPTYSIPDKLTPNDTVSKIFLKTTSGKYFDIKRAIAQEKSTLVLHDAQNRTIVHWILYNIDLDKNDKYNLIKSVIEIGAPIDIADINGVRPLHIAAGQQNNKVIKLLLEKGAEPNSKDNNYMTPLHYAVSPDTQICKRRNKDIKSIIPNTIPVIDFRTDALFDQIYNLFRNDEIIMRYIKHLASIFRFHHLYPDQKEDSQKIKKIVIDVMGEKVIPNIEQSYNEKLIDLKKKIYETSKNTLSLSLTGLNIKENTINGWSPLVQGKHENKYAFLSVTNLHDAYNEKYMELMNAINPIVDGSMRKFANLHEKFEKLNNNIHMASLFLELLNDYSSFARALSPNINFNKFVQELNINTDTEEKDYPRAEFANMNDQNIRSAELPLTNDQHIRLSGVSIVINYYIISIKNILGIIFKNIKHKFNNNIESQKKTIIDLGNIQLYLVNLCYILILLENYTDKLSTALQNFKDNMDTYELKDYIIHISSLISDIYIKHNEQGKKIMLKRDSEYIYIDKNNNANNNYVVYYTKQDNKFIYSYNPPNSKQFNIIITSEHESEPHDNSPFIINTKTRKYYHIDIKINDIKVVTKEDLKQLFKNLDSIIACGSKSSIKNTERKNCVIELYEAVYELQEQINSYINIFNMLNGFIFINAFNNNMIENTAENPETNIITHMLMTMMEQLKVFPKSFRKFKDMLKPIFSEANSNDPNNTLRWVATLINEYGYNLSEINKMIVIDNSEPPVASALSATSASSAASASPIASAAHIVDTQFAPQPQINGILTNLYTDAYLSSNNFITQGHFEMRKEIPPTNKEKIVTEELTIMRMVYDYHIYIIKLVMIMYFVQNIVNIYENKAGPMSKNDQLFHDTINDVIEDISKMTSDDSFGILLAIIGKMVDGIIISTIDNMANISASNYIHYLLGKDKRFRNTNESLLVSDEKQLITKPNDRLKDVELLSSVISAGISNQLIFDPSNSQIVNMLQFFNNSSSINYNYNDDRLIDFDSLDGNNDICFDIDEDVIVLLLTYGANPNILERSGKSPLMLAIYLQNNTIVETLLKSGSKIIINNTNAYELCFQQLLNIIESSPTLNIDQINKRVVSYLFEKTDMDQMFTNDNLILKMTMYLLDHQMTSNASVYPNMWNRNQHLQVLNIIGMKDISHDIIPLAKIDDTIISANVQGFATFNDTIDQYSRNLITERDIYIRITNSIKNMNDELSNLKIGNDFRQQELQELIKELTQQQNNVMNNIDEIIDKIKALDTAKKNFDNSNAEKAIIKNIKSSNAKINTKNTDICNIYNEFFHNITDTLILSPKSIDATNDEYLTYIKLWNKLLTRSQREIRNDYTQMIHNLQYYILEQGIVDPDIFSNAYEPIIDLYDKVLNKYGRDYIELSSYLSDGKLYDNTYNYVLKQTFCIMVHVFKHTMSINFINTVAQLLVKQDKGRSRETIMRNIFNVIKTSGFIKHCVDILPKQVIKSVCKISIGENDPDASISVVNALNGAIDLLTINTFDNIDKLIIDKIKDAIVPFFSTYMETYTAEMHSCIIKQIKILMVEHRWLQILKLLADKTKLEMHI